MDDKLRKWRNDGKYLPEFLRDFHDQKDFFKFLHETMKIEEHAYAKDINFVAGQCYVIDCFLYKLAAYGYTLQKSRANQNFDDLEETISQKNKERQNMFHKALLQGLEKANKQDKSNKE